MRYLKFLNEKQDDPTFEDEMENISSVIRKMAKSQGFNDSSVSVGEDNILIEIVLKKEETFMRVMQMLNFIKKVQKDILTDFKCDMDLWETKKNSPIFTFEFYYSESSQSVSNYDYENDFPF